MDPTLLPSIFTDAEVALYAGTIAVIVGVLQNVSWIPMPEGSRARATAVSLIALVFVGLQAVALAPTMPLNQLILAFLLSWAAVAAASLGLNRAGTSAVKTVTTATAADAQG